MHSRFRYARLMAQLVGHIISGPNQCVYLEREQASLEYKAMIEVTPEECQAMLVRGWRRFGPEYFRPVCGACQKCVSIRVPVAAFRPTHSQRRALHKCREVRLQVGPPQVDEERIALYHRWHAMREDVRGWNKNPVSFQQYFYQFCFPHPCAREFAYYLGERLIGVGLVDETPCALSSIYFFFDPDVSRLSLGIAAALMEIEVARQRGLEHVYLGYWVPGCASMEYKRQFRPHELLVGRPEENEEPVWVPEDRFPLVDIERHARP
ncbi:MAG: arginyltransferase [Verrucomicrobiota bacterium]